MAFRIMWVSIFLLPSTAQKHEISSGFGPLLGLLYPITQGKPHIKKETASCLSKSRTAMTNLNHSNSCFSTHHTGVLCVTSKASLLAEHPSWGQEVTYCLCRLLE